VFVGLFAILVYVLGMLFVTSVCLMWYLILVVLGLVYEVGMR